MSDPLKDINKDIRSRIEKFGWTAVSVYSDDESGDPPFTYSVAFADAFQAPEVVMIGFDSNLSQEIISIIARRLKEKTLTLSGREERIPNIIQRYDVLVRPVDPKTARVLARAAFSMNKSDTKVVQICIPDKNGRLPGDPECDARFSSYQDYGVFTPNRKLC